jgi:hypothetical protein
LTVSSMISSVHCKRSSISDFIWAASGFCRKICLVRMRPAATHPFARGIRGYRFSKLPCRNHLSNLRGISILTSAPRPRVDFPVTSKFLTAEDDMSPEPAGRFLQVLTVQPTLVVSAVHVYFWLRRVEGEGGLTRKIIAIDR